MRAREAELAEIVSSCPGSSSASNVDGLVIQREDALRAFGPAMTGSMRSRREDEKGAAFVIASDSEAIQHSSFRGASETSEPGIHFSKLLAA